MTHRSIGLVGRRRTGKDTAAGILVEKYGYARVGFADALKSAALALDPIIWPVTSRECGQAAYQMEKPIRLSEGVDAAGWESLKDGFPEVRRILQRLGDEAGRQVHGEDTWLNQGLQLIGRHQAAGTPVVVSDVRYPNEVAALRTAGFLLARLTRGSVSHATLSDAHASESGTDDLAVDLEINNSGTIQNLEDSLRRNLAV